MIRFLISLAVVSLSVPEVPAADDNAALKQIQDELANRRKLRQRALEARGVVFAPMEVPAEWLKEKREFRIDQESLGLCGQTFATLTRKEVMISGRLVKKEITLYLERATVEEAESAFRRALDELGVAIVPIGAHILALVDAREVAK